MAGEKKDSKKYILDWGMELKPFYKPEDLTGIDYEKDIGDPGNYPYIRGTFPLMYR